MILITMSKTKIYRQITKMTLLYLLFLGQNCGEDLLRSSLKDLFPGCIKGCWSDSEDRTAFYLPGWKPLNNYSHLESVNDICPKPWRYQSASETDTLSHEAVEESYEGGGYVAELGYNQVSAAKVIEPLLKHNRCLIHLPRYSVKSEMYTKSSQLGRLSLRRCKIAFTIPYTELRQVPNRLMKCASYCSSQ